jgi:hypothetical protein
MAGALALRPDRRSRLPQVIRPYVGWFLWMFRQLYAWTKRGAQGGERGFDKLAAAADSLQGVRASLVEMRLWTLDRGDYLRQT